MDPTPQVQQKKEDTSAFVLAIKLERFLVYIHSKYTTSLEMPPVVQNVRLRKFHFVCHLFFGLKELSSKYLHKHDR